jgi:hypothetical protein
MRQRLAVLPLLTLLLVISGCKDPYGASAKAGADVAAGVTQGLNTVQQLQVQGVITAQEALNVAGYLEFANKADEAFLSCAKTAHTNGDKPGTYTACAQVFNTTLNNSQQLALIHVGNTNASQTITTIVNGITTGVTALETALGGA